MAGPAESRLYRRCRLVGRAIASARTDHHRNRRPVWWSRPFPIPYLALAFPDETPGPARYMHEAPNHETTFGIGASLLAILGEAAAAFGATVRRRTSRRRASPPCSTARTCPAGGASATSIRTRSPSGPRSSARRSRRRPTTDMRKHWRVEDGEIINDGQGAYLTTDKDYGDFELLVDWRMTAPRPTAASTSAARRRCRSGTPRTRRSWTSGADKGSGGLWNNNAREGKYPLVKADKPFGEWNTFRILHDRRARDGLLQRATRRRLTRSMENYWDRKRPLPAAGPIQLQTHGGEMRFAQRLHPRDPRRGGQQAAARAPATKGFKPSSTARTSTAGSGRPNSYEVKDGAIVCKPGKRRQLYTKEHVRRLRRSASSSSCRRAATTAWPSATPAKATRRTWAWRSQILDDDRRRSTTDIHDRAGARLGLRHRRRRTAATCGRRASGTSRRSSPGLRASRSFLNGTTIIDADLSKVTEPSTTTTHPGKHRTEGTSASSATTTRSRSATSGSSR